MRITNLFFALSFFLGTTAFAATPKVTQVEMKTNFGDITLELYPDKAPKTVENFLQYVKEGHFKGTVFHRVIPGFMVQGGGFDKALQQKPAKRQVENEAANGLKNEIGTIAMARTPDPHSASAQFFINVADNVPLNYTSPTPQGYGYAVFGKVTKGMDIVNKIAAVPTGRGGPFPSDVPREAVVIEDIKLIETAKPAADTAKPKQPVQPSY